MSTNSIKKNAITLLALFCILVIGIIYFAGCSDNTTNNPTVIDNPNVKTYDSVIVEEDSALQKLSTINLQAGTSGLWNDGNRDASLADSASLGYNFFLRTGTLDNKLAAGYETRFFLVRSDMTRDEFDTMSAVYDNIGSAFDTTDFTQFDTYGSPFAPWGYFNAPLTSHPVYCFWLEGKAINHVTSKNVFGILQPIEATDSQPGAYGFRMSFRIRININGENDFRKKINQ